MSVTLFNPATLPDEVTMKPIGDDVRLYLLLEAPGRPSFQLKVTGQHAKALHAWLIAKTKSD
jgi:hypothetical protein